MKASEREESEREEQVRHELEGEGSHSAGAAYRAKTQSFVEEGRVDEAAREAERAVEGPERSELERAEAEGKARRKEDDV